MNALSPHNPDERLRLLIRHHGVETVSFQALERGVQVWHGPNGAVGYVDTGAAWVSAGAPFAPPKLRSLVARNFFKAARQEGRRVCFCAVESAFDPEGRFNAVQIGAQAYWDPRAWAATLALTTSRSLREQLRRARAKKVVVRRVGPHELVEGTHLRAAVDRLLERWLASQGMPALRFLLDVQLFHAAEDRRIYAAQIGDALVGLLNAVPVYGRDGWFFEDILRDPLAPNGTTELLIDAAMRHAAEEGNAHVTMGLVPLAGNVPWWMKSVRLLGNRPYDFDGLRRFREKLKPQGWEPVFVRYPDGQTALSAIWDTLTAVTGGCPFAWAIRARSHR
ncbi:MAG: DUF2156 domain-containing protein [Myxococcaceae bacterium]|nr:DUF2156 domain-containing protein [Myxococcaceae bacterium]